MRKENDVLQAAVIPAGDKIAERLDAVIEGIGEFAFPVDAFALELPVERRHRETRGLHGDRHAGGEHGIEEFRRVV